jgi:hypothetical protein
LLEVGGRHRLQGTDGDDAGIVHQDVDASEAVGGGGDHGGRLVGVGDVAGDRDRLAAVGGEHVGGAAQLVGVTGAQHDAAALPPQLTRDQQAEAARRPRDQRDLTTQVRHARPPQRHRADRGDPATDRCHLQRSRPAPRRRGAQDALRPAPRGRRAQLADPVTRRLASHAVLLCRQAS